MSIFEKPCGATKTDEPARHHFWKHGRRRKPPLNVTRKQNPNRAKDDEQSTADSDLPQAPAGRHQQTEKFRAPVKRKPTLEIENEKAVKLRTKKRRVVRHWHIHQQRRATGTEIEIFRRKRWFLPSLRKRRGRPNAPFVHSNSFRRRKDQPARWTCLGQKLAPHSRRRTVQFKCNGYTEQDCGAKTAPLQQTYVNSRA